jgi:hypothetical protein
MFVPDHLFPIAAEPTLNPLPGVFVSNVSVSLFCSSAGSLPRISYDATNPLPTDTPYVTMLRSRLSPDPRVAAATRWLSSVFHNDTSSPLRIRVLCSGSDWWPSRVIEAVFIVEAVPYAILTDLFGA